MGNSILFQAQWQSEGRKLFAEERPALANRQGPALSRAYCV